MASPLSSPVWTVITKLDIAPTSDIFTKWWKKTKTDARVDTWRKLARYLQCMRYFNQLSDQFWSQMSVNPTYWSVQRIAVSLAQQANWLKGTGLDVKDVQNKYYEAASEITQAEPKVKNVMKVIESLWPAQFKPVNLHYDGEPFCDTVLFAQEDSSICRKMAKPKGLKVPDSFFMGCLTDTSPDEEREKVR